MKLKFYQCELCGKIVEMVQEGSDTTVCCGQPMKELVPGSVDAAVEKHVPVVTTNGNKVTVTVGAVAHPMTEEHYIQWIAISTVQGMQRKVLTPSAAPTAEFLLSEGDEFTSALAYCNLHGLWKSE